MIFSISIQKRDLSTAALSASAQDDNLIFVLTGTYSDNLIVISTGAQRAEWRNLKQAVWLNRDQLSTLFGVSWTDEASLVVSAASDDDLQLLNLNFVNDETFFNFSCYETASSQ